MADRWTVPSKELSCPVCMNTFKEPVLLPCSHSFCDTCVRRWWRTDRTRQCPVCRTVCPSDNLPKNLVLKNLCDALRLEMESTAVCELHNERLKLYCLDHRKLACLICRDSETHLNHRFIPVGEAAERHRNALRQNLKPLREKARLFNDVKAALVKRDEEIGAQARDTEEKINEEFRLLEDFLHTERNIRICALKDEEEKKRKVVKQGIEALNQKISAVESTLKSIKGGLKEEDASFLLKVDALSQEAQRPLPDDPEQVSVALIEVAKHLQNINFTAWYKMKEIVSYTPVILNPNSAHEELHLSEGLTSVQYGPKQEVPADPGRMQQHRCVLGCEGITSGTHIWDVETGDNQVWSLGVITQEAWLKDDIMSGLWRVRYCSGKLAAYSPPQEVFILPPKNSFQRVRVHLDWERGQLCFQDPDTKAVIHSFTHKFTGKLFPYINTWGEVPLKILPNKIAVTLLR